MTSATIATVLKTVEAMRGEIGLLRQLVAIDNMPLKLQTVRHLLMELEVELLAAQAISDHYTDRAHGAHANRAR